MRERSATPDCTLDPRTAVEQLQLLVRTVRQRLVRLAQVERDSCLGARRDERVEDDQVVELRNSTFSLRGEEEALSATHLREHLNSRVPLPRDLLHRHPDPLKPPHLRLTHLDIPILLLVPHTQRPSKRPHHTVRYDSANLLHCYGCDGLLGRGGEARGGLQVGNCAAQVAVRGADQRVESLCERSLPRSVPVPWRTTS